MSTLEKQGFAVQELPAETGTAHQAAQALGVTPKQIVKSLVVVDGGVPLMVLAAGDRLIDLEHLGRQIGGADLRMARASEVKEITGFAIGGVPPLAHLTALSTYLDARLLEEAVVYAAAGTRFRVFAAEPLRLQRLTAATIVELSRSDI